MISACDGGGDELNAEPSGGANSHRATGIAAHHETPFHDDPVRIRETDPEDAPNGIVVLLSGPG